MKNWLSIPFQIGTSQQCKKFNKHLIISRTVHLVNNKHDWADAFTAHTAQELKHLIHFYLRILHNKIRHHTIQFLHFLIFPIFKSITQHTYKGKRKCIPTLKFFIRHLLKIQRKHKIIFRQILSQSPQGGSLPILPALIDDKITPIIHIIFFYLFQSAIKLHHIMPLGHTGTRYIKSAFHTLYLPHCL